ncbi:MAG TPA: phosphoribosylanthranilate isomerase [Gemmatimonadales bacterium]|nr:phosphoribosylanthranilate isomerase [Gemmatimonadales bacterium]
MAVRVKICGLTRPEDAAAAAGLGAAYLGVVFAGGPRMATPARAAGIVSAAQGVPVFGVFGSQTAAEVLAIAGQAGLSGAQLHGAHSAETAALLRAAGLRVWRVVRIASADGLELLAESASHADAVLVEPRVPHAEGGSGTPLDLNLARGARARLAGPMVLAGGLTPTTVAEAIDLVRPEVVDVSSGVERLPGIKDPDQIARFLEAALGHSPTIP